MPFLFTFLMNMSLISHFLHHIKGEGCTENLTLTKFTLIQACEADDNTNCNLAKVDKTWKISFIVGGGG